MFDIVQDGVIFVIQTQLNSIYYGFSTVGLSIGKMIILYYDI